MTTINAQKATEFLIAAGFEKSKIAAALAKTGGDVSLAQDILLTDEDEFTSKSKDKKSSASQKHNKATASSNGSGSATSTTVNGTKEDEAHVKFLTTFKVKECPNRVPHDKRVCMFYHSKNDRRRNPYAVSYSSAECPNMGKSSTCPDGDACLCAHGALEKMFHPDLYKITLCGTASKCERGKFCAFAHSDEDQRTPAYLIVKQEKAKQSIAASSASSSSSSASSSSSNIPASSEAMQKKLVELIKKQGGDGILGSDLPKRYAEAYNERLDLCDESGEKFRLKDLLLAHPHITMRMHKGVQPRYTYTTPAGGGVEASTPNDSADVEGVASETDSSSSSQTRRKGPASQFIPDSSSSSSTSSNTSTTTTATTAPPTSSSSLQSSLSLSAASSGLDISNAVDVNQNLNSIHNSSSSLISSISSTMSSLSTSSNTNTSTTSSSSSSSSFFDLQDNSSSLSGVNGFSSTSSLFGGDSQFSFLSSLGAGSLQSSLGGLGLGLGLGSANDIAVPGGTNVFPPPAAIGSPFRSILGTHHDSDYSLPGSSLLNNNLHGNGHGFGHMENSSSSSSLLAEKQLAQATANIQTMEKQISNLKSELASKDQLLQSRANEIASYDARVQAVEESLRQTDGNLKAALHEIAHLKEEIKSKDLTITKLTEQNTENESAAKKAERSIKSLVPELNLLRAKLKTSEASLETTQNKLETSEKANASLRAELASHVNSEAMVNMKKQCEATENELRQSVKERENLMKTIESLKKENARISSLASAASANPSASSQSASTSSTSSSSSSSSHSDSTTAICAFPKCNQPAPFICTGCTQVYYCGPDHQKLCWKDHKRVCLKKN